MNKGCKIDRISIPQLGNLRDISLDGDTDIRILGPNPTSFRLGWLLSMCFSVHDETIFLQRIAKFGWDVIEEELFHEDLTHQFSWRNSGFVQTFLGGQREFSLRISVRLNGFLIGWLRSKAIRSSEILQAIMTEPVFSFRFSLIIDNTFSVASCVYSDFKIGNWRIPLGEKPQWISLLLLHLQGIFCFAEGLDVAKLAKKSLLSIEEHANYLNFVESLSSLGNVRVVESGEHPFLLFNEELFAMYGPGVGQATQQAAGLYLSGASIVLITGEPLCSTTEDLQLWSLSKKWM